MLAEKNGNCGVCEHCLTSTVERRDPRDRWPWNLLQSNKLDTNWTEKALLAQSGAFFIPDALQIPGEPAGAGLPLYTHFAKGAGSLRTAIASGRFQPEFCAAVIDRFLFPHKARDAHSARSLSVVRPVLVIRSAPAQIGGQERATMSWVRAKSASPIRLLA